MKRVLFVIDSMESGGAQRALISLLKKIEMTPDFDYDVSLLICSQKGVFMSSIPGTVNRVNPGKPLRMMMASFGSLAFLRSLCLKGILGELHRYATLKNLRKRHPDWHETQLFWHQWKNHIADISGEYDIAVAFLEGFVNYLVIDKVKARRKILWIHNQYSQLSHSHDYDAKYFREADAIVTVSDQCVCDLENSFPEIRQKIYLLENISLVNEIESKARSVSGDERTEGVLNLLTIGRLSPQKGIHLLVEAAKELKASGSEYVWRIIGGGPQERDICEWIVDAGLEDQISLLGIKENPYSYIEACDCFVQTSVFEGKSVVIDEAKILCKPIVSTSYDSVLDTLKNEVSGLIVEMDGKAIAEAILRITSDEILKESLISNLEALKRDLGSPIEDYKRVLNGDNSLNRRITRK